jgi:hypothetical protein
MLVVDQINGGARLYDHKNLRGSFHGREENDGPLTAIIKDTKIRLFQPADENSALVRDA